MWDRDRSTENDDRLRRDNQLFSHPQLTQEFARQKVSTTQNKTDKSIYGDVLESASLLQQTDTCKDMVKAGELTVEKAKAFVNIQTAFSKAISSTHHQHRNYLCTALKENGLLRTTASLDNCMTKPVVSSREIRR